MTRATLAEITGEDFLPDNPLDVDLLKEALDVLWELIFAENNAMIGISVEKDKLNPGGYVVLAKLADGKIFHYAAYITPWQTVEVDGF